MGTDKTDPLKQNQIPSLPLIRAGREIRGQISLSTCVRKKLNREPRERTRKEDEEFEQKETVAGRGGSPAPLSCRMAM